MRVIAGKARGVRLSVPRGRSIRPTADRVREACFSILGPRIENAGFIDLFAGTGANGIEALSRGAAWVVFVDAAPRSLAVVKANLDAADLGGNAVLLRSRLPRDLTRLARQLQPAQIVFADPPYDFTDYEPLLAGVARAGLLAPEGLLILEHASRLSFPEGEPHPADHSTGGVSIACTRRAEYGDTTLSFFA